MEERQNHPVPFILSFKNPSRIATLGTRRNAYWATLATLGAGVLVFLTAWGLPHQVEAFLGFNFFTHSSAASSETPYYNPEDIDLPEPATNPDPNPNKGALAIAVTSGSALIGNSGPDGSLPEGIEGTKGDSISLYQVRPGDSLSEIADMFGVSINTILWANDIKDAKTIQPGDTLLILPVSGLQHTVVKGETLASIAKKFSADADEIAAYNGIEGALSVGATIIIPGGDLAPKPVAKATGVAVSSKALPALTGYFGNPVPGARLTQGLHGHNGVDLGAPNGTPVYASAAGTVIVAKNNGGYNGGYGNYIVVSHANGTQTLYAHLSSVAISVGQTVEKGQKLGGVGSTGKSTGNHLHFEVRCAKNPFTN